MASIKNKLQKLGLKEIQPRHFTYLKVNNNDKLIIQVDIDDVEEIGDNLNQQFANFFGMDKTNIFVTNREINIKSLRIIDENKT